MFVTGKFLVFFMKYFPCEYFWELICFFATIFHSSKQAEHVNFPWFISDSTNYVEFYGYHITPLLYIIIPKR